MRCFLQNGFEGYAIGFGELTAVFELWREVYDLSL
jgi:hypothetical protein